MSELAKLKNEVAVLIAFDERTMQKPESDKVWFDGRIAGYQNVMGVIDRAILAYEEAHKEIKFDCGCETLPEGGVKLCAECSELPCHNK